MVQDRNKVNGIDLKILVNLCCCLATFLMKGRLFPNEKDKLFLFRMGEVHNRINSCRRKNLSHLGGCCLTEPESNTLDTDLVTGLNPRAGANTLLLNAPVIWSCLFRGLYVHTQHAS